MKITFRRDLTANFMVIENAQGFCEDDFEVKMLKNNSIKGLLKFDYENINERVNLLYDISSRQALSAVFEAEKMTYERLKGFLLSLKYLAQCLEGYFLDINNIILRKECIFMDINSQKCSFCYDPYYHGDLYMETGMLFDELLSEVDYEDAKAVKLIYDLNRECHRENFTLENLTQLLNDVNDAPALPKKDDEIVFEKETVREIKSDPAQLFNPAAADVFNEEQSPGFLKKVSFYLKGKSIYDVVADIDSGQIKSKIKESAPLNGANDKKKRKPAPEHNFKIQEINEPAVYMAGENKEDVIFEEISLNLLNLNKDESEMETSLLRDDAAHCLIGRNMQQGRVMQIDSYPFTIGKLKDQVNGVCASPAISRIHCRIHENDLEKGDYYFEDLNSKNGSYINNIRVNPYKKMPLRPGDIIKIADEEYVFR